MGPETEGRWSLRDVPLFAGIAPKTTERIEAVVFQRDYASRQVIFFPGDPGDTVYWVCTGRVRIMRTVQDRREFTYRHLLPGDVFGEESVFWDGPRRDYAEALEATMVASVRVDAFRRAAQGDPEFTWRLATGIASRLVDTEARLIEVAHTSVRRRIARALMRAYERERGGKKRDIPITHHELASLIGSTRETTTATLQSFRNAEMIALSNRCVRVLDPSALAQFGSGEDFW